MAAGEGGDEEVRVLQTLRGKICQAKNLVPYSGPNKMRDCFCTINLDQEEVYRTQVVEKSLSPFFGEEFYFEVPRIFQCLSFYVYDKNVLQRDLRIGKVAIKKEDLSLYSGRETWFTLQPVDSNSEVQNNRWSCFFASRPFIPRNNKEHNNHNHNHLRTAELKATLWIIESSSFQGSTVGNQNPSVWLCSRKP